MEVASEIEVEMAGGFFNLPNRLPPETTNFRPVSGSGVWHVQIYGVKNCSTEDIRHNVSNTIRSQLKMRLVAEKIDLNA